jgi:flagella basal body P-ring formation protein FlgA
MFFKIVFFLPFFAASYLNAANLLKEIYYVDTHDINLSTIVLDSKEDTKLFDIPINKHSLRLKARYVKKRLNELGYKDYEVSSSYINFKMRSPIDMSDVKKAVIEFYEKNYEIIDIKDVQIQPRNYIETLPNDYSIHLQSRNYLDNNGIVSIKTLKNRKIFFDYVINANLPIYITKDKIKKDTPISAINVIKKSIILDKLRAKPIQDATSGSYQSKYNIAKDKVLTDKNLETLSIIKRGSNVNVAFKNNGINISFSAQAMQEGKMGDIITVQNKQKKRFRVKVIGKNKTEMH